mmetsp:Transcript_19696/g.39187  ORF Transcript_19696/g.39187 Transcript_19696/m.39187 type:complete len:97 (+) Transcript_19696:972-1262(+)
MEVGRPGGRDRHDHLGGFARRSLGSMIDFSRCGLETEADKFVSYVQPPDIYLRCYRARTSLFCYTCYVKKSKKKSIYSQIIFILFYCGVFKKIEDI